MAIGADIATCSDNRLGGYCAGQNSPMNGGFSTDSGSGAFKLVLDPTSYSIVPNFTPRPTSAAATSSAV